MMLLGISGKAGTGKDYTARLLRETGFRPWSLAWHFKVWIVGQGLATFDEVFVTKPPHVRHLLQQYGTEQGRMVYGDDIWCTTMLTWLQLLGEQWGVERIVVPDVRFPNEVQAIHRAGGKVMRLHAPERAASSGLSLVHRQHVSETALDTFDAFDAIVANDPGADLVGQLVATLQRFEWHSAAQSLALRNTFVLAA